MRKNFKFLMNIKKNMWFGMKTSFHASKKYFSAKCLLLLFTTFVPLVTIWLWKNILNGITDVEKDYDSVIISLIIYLTLQMFIYLSSKFDYYINQRYREALDLYINNVMIDKMSRMDLAYFDSATIGDKVQHARSNFSILTDATGVIFSIISAILNIVVTFIIVSSYKWWVGLLTLIFLIPFVIYNKKYSDKRLQMEKEQIRDNRKMDYYTEVYLDSDIQFEIKLNNIGGYFINKYKTIWQKLYKINNKENVKHGIVNTILMIVNILMDIVVLLVSIVDVFDGKMGIGNLQYNISMITLLRSQASGIMTDINKLLVDNTRIDELQEFFNIVPEFEKCGDLQPSQQPKIEFCNVSFHYPSNEQYILKNCSFEINPHEKIGLIGLNGSGKSTIIKLMFRFYDPQKGVIKLDGINIKEYDIYAVRKIFGVLFQDFVKYSLPLREIIALSDFEDRFNNEKLEKACHVSGTDKIICNWEKGYDTVLGRYYENNGKELSGGQWQIVSLARAYFKDSEYMILDEPSAALDPISEDRIFEQLYHLSEGKSSVTISHRLSNTTLADKILVIGDGHIIEQGSHFDLLKQNGEYAHLFNLQASKYM